MPAVTLAQAVQAVAGGLPVLFVDTCALLEVVRFAERERTSLAADLAAASRVLAAQTAGTAGLVMVTSEIVQTEWQDNQRSVLTQVETHVQRVDEDALRVIACATSLGQTIAPPQLPALRVPAALHAFAERMLGAALELPHTTEIGMAAFKRELAGKGPAKKGSKKCLKDCIVTETLLDFARSVPKTGRGPLVFLTYNHRDFASGGQKPHADLAGDFAQLGIDLAFNWSWAAHSLGI